MSRSFKEIRVALWAAVLAEPDVGGIVARGKLTTKEVQMSERRSFTAEEARRVGEEIGIEWASSLFGVEEFRAGMDVELEHGLHDTATNVTGDDPHVTGKIARAHLSEFPDYYTRLERMEEEAKRDWASRADNV